MKGAYKVWRWNGVVVSEEQFDQFMAQRRPLRNRIATAIYELIVKDR